MDEVMKESHLHSLGAKEQRANVAPKGGYTNQGEPVSALMGCLMLPALCHYHIIHFGLFVCKD